MMHASESPQPDPVPSSWALTDDQRNLLAASQRFARERLVPLLSQSPSATVWQETVKQAAALDLGTMILPTQLGGMAINRHDLSLIIEALAAGPLERTAELTLSAPALMTMCAHQALDGLPTRNIQDYFDGTTSIALSMPDTDTASLWRLRSQAHTSGLTLWIDTGCQKLVLIEQPTDSKPSPYTCIARLGALCLEQFSLDEARADPPLATLELPDCHGNSPAQTWLTEAGLYLCALLIGAMQHSVQFALDYGTTRQAFRKPLVTHQLVATRLADMLITTHSSHLFLRSVANAHPAAPASLIRQLVRHVAAESVDLSRELVQFCGGHGYVEGFPPAVRFQTNHWFAWLLMRIDAALAPFTASAQPQRPDGGYA
ncbi:acyl-CoA dehydrogenase family protein [Burkholderia sp. Ac-20353]|uniref:acyl-CoA dehydrogenase family protein n=1 Tax=Burkholderia sp. Ac-20353 TaxID=2703894 RepID=UPI00197C8884|nr:acyl-CoA dehydrogenase family protein [Burkholderia sp. Ac-20353]MBN3787485.1 acyl-CoA dehydrogenase [Burkholderia sp. Ac-20353]